MRNKLRLLFKNISIKYKLLTAVLFNVVTISIISFVGYSVCTNAYNDLLFKAIAGNLSFSSYTISEKLHRIESLSTMICSSSTIQTQLSIADTTDDPSATSNASKEFNNALLNYYSSFKSDGISYMVLYNDKFNNCTNWALLQQTDKDLIERSKEAGIESDGAISWNYGKRNDYLILARHVRKIENLSLAPLGDLLICVDMNKVVTDSNQAITLYDNTQNIITTADNNLIYASNSLTDSDAEYFLNNSTQPYQIIQRSGKTYFSILGTLPDYNYKYIHLISFDDISYKLRMILDLMVFALVGGIIAAVLLSNYVIKSMLKQFDALILKMHAFSHSKNIVSSTANGQEYAHDEIGQLHQQFDFMASDIQNLIKVNYANELLTKEARIKALESQINPHFLYNTLESVNWRAKASGDTQISQLVESLGQLLRVTLSNKKALVTLAYELDLVSAYMTIEKIRYEDRLLYQFCVEDDCLHAVIPPLTIQPLLENAIRYGVEEMVDACHIYLIARTEGDHLIIQVKNEGSAFEPDLLEQIEANTKSVHGFGIGLLNINQRIKLLFGQDYGLSLSNQDNYATATITLPFRNEDE